MAKAIFEISRPAFEAKALEWAQQYNQVCYLQSNGYTDEYSTLDAFLAVEAAEEFCAVDEYAFEQIEQFKTKHPKRWMLGFFSYDLKNEMEELRTSFPNPLDFPNLYFFVPKTTLKFSGSVVEIEGNAPQQIFQSINDFSQQEESLINPPDVIQVKKRMSKEKYLDSFEKMIAHIKRGDIYEVNLCQEFYDENVLINPLATYRALNKISPTPFSSFFKLYDKFILCASPERFLAKRGKTLVSQPIKGTAPRGKTKEEDDRIKTILKNNPKEIAENVMIVDLVRNDMTRSSQAATVQANKKLEIQSFKQVHQLVSTITGVKRDEISDITVIKNLFPPGSMTGAPKISAMHLCDLYENSRRGVYAGSVGYFAPDGNFDFNVVIRSILYNQSRRYLSFHTGGAVTYHAQAEDEYKECLLKASAITTVLKSEIN